MVSPRRRSWSSFVRFIQEDEAIKRLVEELGERQWSKVVTLLQSRYKITGRSGKQCRERWLNHLNPSILKDEWSQEDETMLFELHKKFGNSWSEIAKHWPGRTDNSLKNHFYSTVRRNISQYNKAHSVKIPFDLKQLPQDPDLLEVILRPNYQPPKKQKQEQTVLRRSGRKRTKVNYKISSSEEEKSETANENTPKNICLSPPNKIPELLESPSSQVLSPHSFRHFVFPDEFKIIDNFQPTSHYEEFIAQSDLALPPFSPKKNI